ncbi:MAG TPA: mechanosensitive ion channel domain-containing protein, partial [Dokdonella sp.]
MEWWRTAAAIGWPLLAAFVIGWLVRRGLLALARRARADGGQRLRSRVMDVIAVPAAVALPLLFLGLAIAATPLGEAWSRALARAFVIGGVLCLTWLAVRAIDAIEKRVFRLHRIDVADNLAARRAQTQTHVIAGAAQGAVVLVGVAIALMTFPQVRQIGATLLASAGVVGLVAGIAAKPVFGNLIAGLQIAIAQPIRFDDVVIVEGEWGRIEEITATYVVVRIWDERRLVVPLQWFVEHPFENWTRTTSQLLGTAFLWLDYRTPMAAVREELARLCAADARWDGRVCIAQVTETDRETMQVRLLVSARNSGDLFDLRCAVREGLIAHLQARHPESLPRLRMDLARDAPTAKAADAGRRTAPDAPPLSQTRSP